MTGSRKGKGQRRSRSQWRSLLGKVGASGLCVEAFCRREGIIAASFRRWRCLLSDAVDSGDIVGHDRAPGFVDLGTLSSQSPSLRLDLKLDLGEGLVVHLARG
jgi:putative transposase